MRRHMHQVRGIDEPADQNCVADSVNCERHKNSLSPESAGIAFATEPTIRNGPQHCASSLEDDAVQNDAHGRAGYKAETGDENCNPAQAVFYCGSSFSSGVRGTAFSVYRPYASSHAFRVRSGRRASLPDGSCSSQPTAQRPSDRAADTASRSALHPDHAPPTRLPPGRAEYARGLTSRAATTRGLASLPAIRQWLRAVRMEAKR